MSHMPKLGLFIGIPMALCALWINACESRGRDDIDFPAPIVAPDIRPVATLDAAESALGIGRVNSIIESTARNETDSDVVSDRRQLAFRNFHEQFREQFSLIEGDFGLSRMWIYADTTRVKHSVRSGSTWTIFQSSLGMRIMPKESDGEIPGFLVEFDEGVADEPSESLNFEDLQSLRYLGSKPDPSFIVSAPNLFEQTAELISGAQPIAEWKLVRLELIGLLKHSTPVSYTSSRVPKWDEFNFIRTAPLNDFENVAIDRLKSNPDQDTVIQDGRSEIQIVGALRAEQQCQKCHDVKRGELLGGLTYRLIRSREFLH